MFFKACAEGEYEAGKTYEQPARYVYVNALRCITPGVAPLSALMEIRLEGIIFLHGEAVSGKKKTVVRMLPSEERCAAWTGVLVGRDGTELWYQNGQLHREKDLPAIVCTDGHRAWYRNGDRHREGDLPAFIDENGYQAWFRDGQRHREGGPALVREDGHIEWWRNGQLHREGGAAVIYVDGTQEWYLNDIRVK